MSVVVGVGRLLRLTKLIVLELTHCGINLVNLLTRSFILSHLPLIMYFIHIACVCSAVVPPRGPQSTRLWLALDEMCVKGGRVPFGVRPCEGVCYETFAKCCGLAK